MSASIDPNAVWFQQLHVDIFGEHASRKRFKKEFFHDKLHRYVRQVRKDQHTSSKEDNQVQNDASTFFQAPRVTQDVQEDKEDAKVEKEDDGMEDAKGETEDDGIEEDDVIEEDAKVEEYTKGDIDDDNILAAVLEPCMNRPTVHETSSPSKESVSDKIASIDRFRDAMSQKFPQILDLVDEASYLNYTVLDAPYLGKCDVTKSIEYIVLTATLGSTIIQVGEKTRNDLIALIKVERYRRAYAMERSKPDSLDEALRVIDAYCLTQ